MLLFRRTDQTVFTLLPPASDCSNDLSRMGDNAAHAILK